MVGKQLMVCVDLTSSAKRSRHAVTLRKAYKYKFCISLPHTHAHGSMYVAACLQLCLPPPLPPPPPKHPNALLQKPCQCVGACVYIRACAYKCHKGRIESLHLSTCECICVCKCICMSHARTYNNGRLKVG